MDSVTYGGDYTKSLHNAILGPDADGKFYVVTSVDYQNDKTTAMLREASNVEVDDAVFDSNGLRHLA